MGIDAIPPLMGDYSVQLGAQDPNCFEAEVPRLHFMLLQGMC
jgi:hypothetical protein